MADERTRHVRQGEFFVTKDADTVCSVILGSCVSACLFDHKNKVGGMNHFLLPYESKGAERSSLRFGAHSMEIMINELLKLGADRYNLKAKVFGGANVTAGHNTIGAQNAAFILKYLENEGIACAARSLGKKHTRRVKFYPTTGQVKMKFVDIEEADMGANNAVPQKPSNPITLF